MSFSSKSKVAFFGSTALFMNAPADSSPVQAPIIPKIAAVSTSSGKIAMESGFSGTSKFEVAPAGTYQQLAASLENYRTLYEQSAAAPSQADAYAPMSWELDADELIDRLAEDAEENGYALPIEMVLTRAREALGVYMSSYTSEPLVSCNERSEVEIYIKEGRKALLAVIQPDGVLSLFGDEPGEQWRSRYSFSGKIWKRRLSSTLEELIAV